MDIHEHGQTRDETEKLHQELLLYEFALDVADEEIILSREDASIAYVNRAACERLGYTREELLSMSVADIDPNYQKKHWAGHWSELKERGNMKFESLHKRKDGSVFPVAISTNYFEYAGESYNLGVARDITDSKAAAEELAYSRRFLKSIFDNEPECVKLLEADGTLLDMNPSGLRMIEAESLEQVRGQKVEGIVAPENREAFASLTRRVCEGETGALQFRIIGLKGTERWLETKAVPFYDEMRKKTVLLGVTRDITQSRAYQDKLESTIAEKEMLMRETYHRVKNNLSVIQSLLRLQHKEVSDEMAREKLRETEDRVRSMGLIHEQLSRNPDLKNIDLTDYLRSLLSKLSVSHKAKESGITVDLDSPSLDIDVNLIIPVGLIVNELVTNSFKYAFPDSGGEIGIAVSEDGGSYSIRVRDNGVGMPEDLDIYHTASLGMQIVTSLAGQLKATLTLETGDGTAFTLRVPKHHNRE